MEPINSESSRSMSRRAEKGSISAKSHRHYHGLFQNIYLSQEKFVLAGHQFATGFYNHIIIILNT